MLLSVRSRSGGGDTSGHLSPQPVSDKTGHPARASHPRRRNGSSRHAAARESGRSSMTRSSTPRDCQSYASRSNHTATTSTKVASSSTSRLYPRSARSPGHPQSLYRSYTRELFPRAWVDRAAARNHDTGQFQKCSSSASSSPRRHAVVARERRDHAPRRASECRRDRILDHPFLLAATFHMLLGDILK